MTGRMELKPRPNFGKFSHLLGQLSGKEHRETLNRHGEMVRPIVLQPS